MLEISLDHGKLYKLLHMASNCTFNSRLDGIKDLSKPKKAVSAPLHWQQQFGLLTQRRSMETILRTQQKCWFIRHVYLFPVFSCPFLVSVGPPETQIVVFGRCTWEPKSYFPFQSCFMCWGASPVKSVHLCGHHFSNYSPLTSRHLDNLAYCIIFVFHHSYYCLENPISYSRNTQTSPNQQQSANN